MTQKEFHAAWDKKYPPGSGVAFGANAIYGYMTGLVVQQTLETTKSLDQMAMHDAVFALSGKLKTLDGTFALRNDGAQIGEVTPLGQLQPGGKDELNLVVVYPPEFAQRQGRPGEVIAVPLSSCRWVHATARSTPGMARLDRAIPSPSASEMARSSRAMTALGRSVSVSGSRADPMLTGALDRRRGVRPVLHPGRPRPEPRVRRHAHRQSRAWRFPDAGRHCRLVAVLRPRPAPDGVRRARAGRLPRRRPAALLPVVPRLLRSRDSEMLSLILFFGLSQMIEAVTTICHRHHRTFAAAAAAWASGRSSCSARACRKPGSSAPPSQRHRGRCWCISISIAPGSAR